MRNLIALDFKLMLITSFFTFLSLGLFGQRTLSGIITDGVGEPLIGASVLVKDTSTGTITDIDGSFSLNVPEGYENILVSYTGYATQEINIIGKSVLTIALSEDSEVLDEVVVVGYATQTRGDITGSVESLDLEEANKAPLVNAADALQGRVSGVTVVADGNPGAAPVVRIRGFGTTGNNDPLYIIDGIQTTDASILNAISPTDIEQMNVLKDGAASIYGARGSNGVIIITTKSGKYNQSKPTISLNAYAGTSVAINKPDLLNSQQLGDVIIQSLRNDGVMPIEHGQFGIDANGNAVVPMTLGSTDVLANQAGTDWLDEIFERAPTQNVDFSISNGNEKSKYSLSTGFLTRDGIQTSTGFQRGFVRLNSEFKVNDRITVGEHLNTSISNSRFNNQVQQAFRSNPLIPVRDQFGNFAGGISGSLGNAVNPVAELERSSDNFFRQIRIIGDVYAKVKLFEGLSFKTSIGGDFNGINDRVFTALNPEHSEPRPVNNLQEQNLNFYNWVWTNTLTYVKAVNKHTFNAFIGTEAISNSGKGSQIRVEDFLFETPDFYLLNTGSGTPQVINAFDGTSTLDSYFGSINYNFDDKYYLSGTLRQDNSSNFLPENTGNFFPSVSAGWVLSNEDFFNKDGALTYVKLKGSYGQLGNQDTGNANNPGINISGLDLNTANYPFGGQTLTGSILRQVGNPNITWETSETTNFGVEIGAFDNNLIFSAEYFRIETEDLIGQDFSLINDLSIDAAAPFVNLGNITNRGFDFALGYGNTAQSGFYYEVEATLSLFNNEVTNLVSEFQTGDVVPFTGTSANRTQVGQPIGSFFGREVDGIYRSEAEVAAGPDQGFASDADGVGRLRYVDQDGNGIIDDDDRTFIGSPHPDYVFGVNFKAGFKGFDVSAFFNGTQGNDIYNGVRVFTDFPTFFDGNRSTAVLDAFDPNTNPNGSQPALSSSVTNNEIAANSFFVEDGSFIRLKNLQIGYTLPSSLTEQIGIPSARIYISGSNLFTITDYSGIDPEISGSGNSGNPLTIGLDTNNFPIARVLLLGVNIKL